MKWSRIKTSGIWVKITQVSKHRLGMFQSTEVLTMCSPYQCFRYIPHGSGITTFLMLCYMQLAANEETLFRTHVSLFARASNIYRGHNICVRDTKNVSEVSFRNISCPQQMFPRLLAQQNIMSNKVSATMCPPVTVACEPSLYCVILKIFKVRRST